MFRCDRVAYVLGVFILISGIVIGFSWPYVYNYISAQNLQLSPSSESYKLWNRTPVPMYLEIYLFNWTNSQEFLKNKKLKPEFEEIGPFVFKEVHQRVGVSWNENGTVSYNQTRTWFFVPEESIDLSTPIFNLNVIATTITRMASGYNNIVKVIIDFLNAIYKENLLISRPAGQWLFDGISDKLLDFIKKFEDFSKETIPYDKFGWFYGRNLSSAFDGRFTINTGRDDIFSLGEMERWNYVNKTKFYEGECGVVRGSSGELFAPIKNYNDSLRIFVSDFCGALTLNFTGQKLVEGLSGYHYVGDENVFASGKVNPSDKCFCTGECSPSGVRNVTSCRQVPLFISFPHFYLADPSYRQAVVGMKPNKTEHEFYLSIDPMSGIPLEVRAQLQLNVLLQPLKGFTMFKDVPKVYVPMMWFRQRIQVTPELESRIKVLQTLQIMGLQLTWVLCALGVLIIITTVSVVKFCPRRVRSELLVPKEDLEEESESRESESCRRKIENFVLPCRNIIIAVGLFLVTLAISCHLFWHDILQSYIEKELELSNSSKSFGLWVENPIPLYIDFYFFNWTNPTDLKQPGYKPKFKEVGPYRFREEVRKVNIKWNENQTVTYMKHRRWYFEPHQSRRDLDDVITSLNVIALSAARSTRYWNRLTRIPLSVTLSSTQKLHLSKKVGEFLFEGFADPLIEFASKIPGLSSQVPFDRFGWFYKRNDSSAFDGVFNVETGARGLDVLGKLRFWNYKNKIPFYEGHCGDVEGSAGDFWPPPKSKTEKITLFSPDMCRYIDFIYTEEKNVGDIRGYRYDSDPKLFDNGTADPENTCFCGGKCYPSGVVNVSSCRFGSPAFVSYPHFHLADPVYLSAIEGLKPHPQKHDMYIILEQKWGIPLEVAIRLQINILIESDSGIRMFDGVPTILFPMLWFEQKVTIPENMRQEIRTLLELPTVGLITAIVLYVIGLSCVLIYVLSCCLRRPENEPPNLEVSEVHETEKTGKKPSLKANEILILSCSKSSSGK